MTGILWDLTSERRLQTLHPAIRDKARAFINKAEEKGIKLRITSAMRTFPEQDELYAKVPKVTNARGGQSFHNYGLAIDVVEMQDGTPIWNNPNWEKIGQLGKEFGFEWGGDWKFKDRPHFQITMGKSINELLALHNQDKYQEGFIKLA